MFMPLPTRKQTSKTPRREGSERETERRERRGEREERVQKAFYIYL